MQTLNQLITACRQGNLDFIQTTLTSHEGQNFSIEPRLVEEAILGGKLDVVQYLLKSNDLPMHCDIHYQKDIFLVLACKANRLEIVKYLLTSPDLKEHCNVHTLASSPIREACLNGYPEMVEYLLTQHNVNISPILYKVTMKRKEDQEKHSNNLKNPKNIDDYQRVLDIIENYQNSEHVVSGGNTKVTIK